MEVIPIKTKILKKPSLSLILNIFKKKLKNNDILVITSKILSWQSSLVNLRRIKISKKALNLAKKYSISPQLAAIIIKEADKILGGVKGVVLTLKNGVLMANAGIDLSNAPEGLALCLPKNIEKIADRIRRKIKKKTSKNIGLIISDSVCLPLRNGTHHFALAVSGFSGIIDERGKKDIFGKRMRFTKRNIADGLASTAGLVMGERSERVPAVIIRGFKIELSNQPAEKLTKELLMPRQEDLFKDIFKF